MSDQNQEEQDNSNIVEQPLDEILESESIDESLKLKLLKKEINMMAYSGPIPHPKILKGYEDILTGSADRILSMVEKQIEHRMRIEGKIVATDSIRSYLGLGAGFIIAIVGLGGSIYLGINDKKWASGILSAGTLTGLVTVFVTEEKRRSSENKQDEE